MHQTYSFLSDLFLTQDINDQMAYHILKHISKDQP